MCGGGGGGGKLPHNDWAALMIPVPNINAQCTFVGITM